MGSLREALSDLGLPGAPFSFAGQHQRRARGALSHRGARARAGEHVASPHETGVTHLGAPAVSGGWVYVPTQRPRGIWKVAADLSSHVWLDAEGSTTSDTFAWCDIHPFNGLLYTSDFLRPEALLAFDAGATGAGKLVRAAAHDLPIRQGSPETTHVQGACFTPNYRVLMLVDVDGAEGVHCHSTLTGALQGRLALLADFEEAPGSERSELEGICHRAVVVGGETTHVRRRRVARGGYGVTRRMPSRTPTRGRQPRSAAACWLS